MPLTLEDHPRVIFETNPLRVVVAQVRFPPIYALEQPAGAARLQEAIRDSYPIAQNRDAQISLLVGAGGMGQSSGQPGPWRFTSEDETWIAAVAPQFVSLETTDYRRFEEFHGRLRELLEATQATLRPARRERLGLRYVNEISHPEAKTVADWERFLHSELLGLAGGKLLQEGVMRAVQEVHVALEELQITIRHGYVRQEEQSLYLLDIDTYEEEPGAFDIEEMLTKAWMYKDWVWRIFFGSITDELRRHLQPTPLEDE